MKLIEKILVATDFGPSSDAAVQQAIDLAKKFDSKVILTHIIPQLDMTTLSEEMVRTVVDRKMESITDLLTGEDIPVETMIETGIPFVQIMKIAEIQDVNVIMIGAGDDDQKAPGITAEKLMHKSIKPVWVLPSQRPSEFRHILCPVDFSETADRALENAIHLARQYDLDLTVLHVFDQRLPSYLMISESLRLKSSAKKEDRLQQFESYLKRFDFFKIRWKKILAEGPPAQEIIRQAQSQQTDLILMGSVGKTAHPKMLTGATARIVFRAMPAPIIVFKSHHIVQLKLEEELVDLRAQFQQGIELMENGFVREALARFKYCTHEDPLFAPAWELLADAHHRLGEEQLAIEYKARASEIRDKLWSQRVESEVKNRHDLYGTKKRRIE